MHLLSLQMQIMVNGASTKLGLMHDAFREFRMMFGNYKFFNASWYIYKYFEWVSIIDGCSIISGYRAFLAGLSDFQSLRNISIWHIIKNSCLPVA
jgi:hypothetical protein